MINISQHLAKSKGIPKGNKSLKKALIDMYEPKNLNAKIFENISVLPTQTIKLP